MASIELKSGSSGSVILDAGNVTGEKRIDILRDLPWLSIPVGYTTQPLMIPDAAYYPTKDSDVYDFIMLSAGEDGVGGYNEGLLINEDIDATYVDGNGHSGLRVTAEINMPSSPLHGVVIDLINSSGAFIRPGETAGVFEHDQMQRITGILSIGANTGFFDGVSPNLSGVFTVGDSSPSRTPNNDADNSGRRINFNSANSPDARTSATTAGQTQPINLSGIVFMRVR